MSRRDIDAPPSTARPANANAAHKQTSAAKPAIKKSSAVNSVSALIRLQMPVRWRDLDAFNHVNNSKFLSYLEEARLQWMLTIAGDWIDESVAPVVAAVHLNYRRPIAWPNQIAVELFVEHLGDTSLTIGHRIIGVNENGKDDAEVLYADGNVVMVWIDRLGGQASALPDGVRNACASTHT